MAKAKKKIKSQKTFYAILGYIVDVVVYPVILISFLSSFFMIVSKSDKKISPIFGYSFVRILSGSMERSNFKKGDVVLVNQKDYHDIRVGDVIAFYAYDDLTITNLKSLYNGDTYASTGKYDSISGLERDESGNLIYFKDRYDKVNNTAINENCFSGEEFKKLEVPENRLSTKDAIEKSTQVNFHMVVNIYVDQTGMLYYETRGTSNGDSDSFKVRGDLIAGKYSFTPIWFRDLISYCSSTEGMLFIVVFPLTLIVLMEMLSVLEQVNNLLLEKKVLKRAINFDRKEVAKANIGIEMRSFDKIYYYDVMPKNKKDEVFQFIWGYLEGIEKKKYKKEYETAVEAVKVYDFEDSNKFWDTFKNAEKKKSLKKKIIKAQKQANADKFNEVDYKEYQNNKDGKPPVVQENIEDKEQSINKKKAKSKKLNKKDINDINKTLDKAEDLINKTKK